MGGEPAKFPCQAWTDNYGGDMFPYTAINISCRELNCRCQPTVHAAILAPNIYAASAGERFCSKCNHPNAHHGVAGRALSKAARLREVLVAS